jgi:phospholipid/cholesterol/gamma-HCH transport system substrate-binding protein
MHLTRLVKIQLAVFAAVALIALGTMTFGYIQLPAMLFGTGQYTVTVQLPQAAGLYPTANVTYRGTEVGRVADVRLTDHGVAAVLELKSSISIPSDLTAAVHSTSAIGEQYVALTPSKATSRPLQDGDVIPVGRTSVPPDINGLLAATNAALKAIPQDNVRTVVDESYTAINGLGPDISRFVKGSTSLAIDAKNNLDALTALIDHSQPVLDSQAQTSDEIGSWAAHLATITGGLKDQDAAVAGLLERAGPAADEARALFDRVQPTLPILLTNLVTLGEVGISYRADLEQLLVLLPQGIAQEQGTEVAIKIGKQDLRGQTLSFNLNVNLPAPCTTGYLPAAQSRSPALTDLPDRPAGDFYCRIPQDSSLNVRGARNIPCETKPWKRAPTARMCESDEEYVPLNDGMSWKGDPNATLSGQDIPQPRPTGPGVQSAPGVPAPDAPPPPVAFAQYDPATGTYVGPDGRLYTRADLARGGGQEQTWQNMLVPPKAN